MMAILLALGEMAGQGAALPGPCIPVTGDRIALRDFTPAIPEMAAAPADLIVGYAPLPGARRVFGPTEVQRIAGRQNLTLAAPVEVCFEHTTRELHPDRALAAMQRTIGIAGARIEILELSKIPVPPGELEFPRELLTVPPGTGAQPTFWRGYVRYGENRRAAVWARVTIRAPLRRVVAVVNLQRGSPISPEAVRLEEYEGFPQLRRPAQTLDQVLGKLPRRVIPAEAPVWPDFIEAPPDVDRGAPVEVAVRNGSTQLSLLATAETAGRVGETISVRNRESGRLFPARVTDRGKAVVVVFPDGSAARVPR